MIEIDEYILELRASVLQGQIDSAKIDIEDAFTEFLETSAQILDEYGLEDKVNYGIIIRNILKELV